MNSSRSSWLFGAGMVFIAGWIEILMVLPLLLLIYAYMPEQLQGQVWLAAVPAALFTGALIGLRAQRLWMQWLLAGAAGAAAIYQLSPLDWPYHLIIGALGVWLPLQGMTIYSRLFRPSVYWMGIVLYFVSSWIFRFLPVMQDSLTLLNWGGVLSICIALYASNSTLLKAAALTAKDQPDRLPSALRRHNRIFSAVVIVAAVLLAAVLGGTAGTAIWRAFSSVMRLLLGQSQDVTQEQTREEESDNERIMPEADGEGGMLGTILDFLFYAMLIGLIITSAVFVIWWLYRRGPIVIRLLLQRVTAFLMKKQEAAATAGYIDEESIVPSSERMRGWVQGGLLGRIFRTKEEKYEEQPDNEARIRFLFRGWLRSYAAQGYEVKKFLTPKETVNDAAMWAARAAGKKKRAMPAANTDALTELYNQARYSNHPLSDSEVNRLKEQLDLKK